VQFEGEVQICTDLFHAEITPQNKQFALRRGLDLLEHASMYIDTQFSLEMPRQAAQDHFDTRATLLNIRNRALCHAEAEEAKRGGAK